MQYQEGIIGHRNRSTSVGPCADCVPTPCGAVEVMADSLVSPFDGRRPPSDPARR